MDLIKKDFIFENVGKLKGVGQQLSKYLKKKKIEKIKDIILNLPYSETDRTKLYKLNELEIGKIQSIKILVKKLNFPRIRNLPNKIICEDETIQNYFQHKISKQKIDKNEVAKIFKNFKI